MTTLADIEASVQRRLVDTNTAITTEITGLVNEALRKIQKLHNFKVMEAQTQYTTVQAQRQLTAMPSDWKASRGSPWIREWDGGTTPMEWGPSLQEMAKIFAFDDATVTGQGKPEYLLWNEDEIQVYPYPDDKSNWAGGGDWRIVMPYWKYLTSLVNPTDENWFTNNAENFLIFQAVAEGFYINFDEERGQMWEQRAAIEFKTTKKLDKKIKMTRQSDTLQLRFAPRGSFRKGR